MIERVEKVTNEAEEITEELTHGIGVIITKTTPLLAPLASGLTVLFSFYDGGGRMLAGKVAWPYLISFAIGSVIMVAVEGINFAAIHNRDRADEARRRNPQAALDVDANSIVNLCLWLTIGIVFALESLPGVVSWYLGEIPVGDMVFRLGLLILPFFSRAGAKIYSLSAILDAIEGVQEKRRSRKRDDAEFSLELEIKRKKAEQDLHIDLMKAQAKLHKPMHNDAQFVVQSNAATTGRTENDAQPPVQNDRKTQAKQLHSEGFSIVEISRLTGAHRNSISAWVKETNGHSK